MKNDDLMNEVNEMLDHLMHPDLDADHEPDEVEIDQALLDLQATMKRNRVSYVITAIWDRDGDPDATPAAIVEAKGSDKDIREALAHAVFRIGTDKTKSERTQLLFIGTITETLYVAALRYKKKLELGIHDMLKKMNRDGEPKN